jgi:hypothetical protein
MGGTLVNLLFVYGYIPSRGIVSVISSKLRMPYAH